MSKLSYEDKINLYNDRKNGFDILKTVKNKYYSPQDKERIINRVLMYNESINSVAIDEGLLSRGMLQNWLRDYKNMGYNIVEQKHERSSAMSNKENKPKVSETLEEENERLKKENLY